MTREIWEISLSKIHPNRRLIFDEETIMALCHDIRRRGVQEPIVVELVEYWFQIVDGEKRWRACRRLGFDKVRARIIEIPGD